MPTDLKALHAENDEATYRAIGRFITKFASVEHTMRFHLAEEIKLDLNYMSARYSRFCLAMYRCYNRILQDAEV
jgi:hypothetical protein